MTDDVMTTKERDRQFDARRDAALAAREVLWGVEEPSAEDIVTVADWLLTGSASLALEFARQTAADYGSRSVDSADAAHWNASECDD